MKKSLNWMILVACGTLNVSAHAGLPFNVYSEGVRVGFLTDVKDPEIKFWKSYRGQMTLGRNSDTNAKVCMGTGEKRKCESVNPWVFNIPGSLFEKFKNADNKPVAIRYEQTNYFNPIFPRPQGDYFATDVVDLNPAVRPSGSCTYSGASGIASSARVDGRIVKASYKGRTGLSSTWEIIVQVGDSGNDFREFSIRDKDLYKCAVQWALSGQRVRLNYKERLIDVSFSSTNFDVESISPAPAGDWVEQVGSPSTNSAIEKQSFEGDEPRGAESGTEGSESRSRDAR